jgi:hypothetical protein
MGVFGSTHDDTTAFLSTNDASVRFELFTLISPMLMSTMFWKKDTTSFHVLNSLVVCFLPAIE